MDKETLITLVPIINFAILIFALWHLFLDEKFRLRQDITQRHILYFLGIVMFLLFSNWLIFFSGILKFD